MHVIYYGSSLFRRSKSFKTFEEAMHFYDLQYASGKNPVYKRTSVKESDR